MGELLRSAVVPKFFEYWIRPAFCSGRFFHRIAVAVFAEGWQGVAHMQICVGHAGFPEDFDAVIHASTARPAVFYKPDSAVCEFEDAQRFVFRFGFIAVNVGAHLAINSFDWRPPQKPVAEGDTVTAEIHQSATAGSIHIPEPRTVRAKMFFTLLDEMNLSECAGVRHFLGF